MARRILEVFHLDLADVPIMTAVVADAMRFLDRIAVRTRRARPCRECVVGAALPLLHL
jgi:hypothetical protein